MLSRRGADGQSVRIPADGSRDVQASIQDVKDALRALEAKHKELKSSLGDLEQRVEKGGEDAASPNFNEINDETVFNSPVTFSQGLFADGDAANPSISFSADQTLGVYRIGDGHFGISADGLATFSILNSGGNAFFYVYDSVAPSTDRLRFQKNGGSAAFLLLDAATAENFIIGTQAHTGDLKLRTNSTNRWAIDGTTGDLLPNITGTYDIGDDDQAVQDIHVDGDIHVGSVNVGTATGSAYGVQVVRASVQSIPNATATAVTWVSANFNDGAMWEGVTNPTYISFPVAGLYLVVFNVRYDTTSVNNTRIAAALRFNGEATYRAWVESNTSAASPNYNGFSVSHLYNAAASEYVEAICYHTIGSAKDIRYQETSFSAKRLGDAL